MRSFLHLVALGVLATGCEQTIGVGKLGGHDEFQQSPTDQVDILFIIDNSGSMKEEQQLLAQGFKSFISEIEATGANFHIGVITTDFDYQDPKRGQLIGTPNVITPDVDYTSIFEKRAIVGLDGDGKEKGLEAAAYALSTEMTTGPNAGFLREAATLLVVVVSDEDDCSDAGVLGLDAANTDCYTRSEALTPVSELVQKFTALKPSADRFKLAGIVGPEVASDACTKSSYPGRRYTEAARLSAGLTSSICESDWSAFMYDLGLNAAGISTVFPLSHGASADTLVVRIDGEDVPMSATDGYTYDAVAHTIEFHGFWIPERGASISVEYTIVSGT